MGAWETGPFDNDDAADWCRDLEAVDPDQRAQIVRGALEAVVGAEYLEVGEASEALAAVAVIAAGRHGGGSVTSPYAPEFLRKGQALAASPDLVALAVQALDRLVGPDSEWRELWEESADGSHAFAQLADLRRALVG